MSRDVAASIRARLLERAREAHEEFELFLVRYASERFLYRLGASALRERCILKGAGLLKLWMNDAASARETVGAICAVPCPEDGLAFDLGTLDISPLRADQEYEGQRVVFRAFLGTARIRLQIDFGFGDSVTPGPEEAVYPTLLPDLPAPRLRTYPRVATVAEKFEIMVHLGRRNSRMKDFHDIWALSSAFTFEGPELQRAIVVCLERRRTPWIDEVPDALSPAFYGNDDLKARWNNYLRAGAFRTAPPASFEAIGERVRRFFEPVRDSVVAGDLFAMPWPPGGPWR